MEVVDDQVILSQPFNINKYNLITYHQYRFDRSASKIVHHNVPEHTTTITPQRKTKIYQVRNIHESVDH